MGRAQLQRGADTLVAGVGRHADVREHHVRALRLDGLQQRVEVAAPRDDLDFTIQLEQSPDALAHDQAVLGKDDADGHPASIRPPLSSWEDLPRRGAGLRAA